MSRQVVLVDRRGVELWRTGRDYWLGESWISEDGRFVVFMRPYSEEYWTPGSTVYTNKGREIFRSDEVTYSMPRKLVGRDEYCLIRWQGTSIDVLEHPVLACVDTGFNEL
ncbi:MAG: hypothetical protein ABIH26_01585 [Candidatus Eisenbacteria bacterium]